MRVGEGSRVRERRRGCEAKAEMVVRVGEGSRMRERRRGCEETRELEINLESREAERL